jgi:hypothetical protein
VTTLNWGEGNQYHQYQDCLEDAVELSVSVSIIRNGFGLIGIELPEKYKENFDVSSEAFVGPFIFPR